MRRTEIEERLASERVEDRLAVLDALCGAADRVAHDDILDLLRGHRDPSSVVRTALFETKRAVAVARGRQRGLRNPRPTEISIDDMADQSLVWGAIELVWDAVSIYDGPRVLDEGLALATPRQRHFYAFWWTQSEVRNGGFHQYFSNATGVVAPIALDALHTLRATAATDALYAACASFDLDQITDRAYRHSVLATLEPGAFRGEDEAFFAAYPQAFELAAAYIRAQPTEFFE